MMECETLQELEDTLNMELVDAIEAGPVEVGLRAQYVTTAISQLAAHIATCPECKENEE